MALTDLEKRVSQPHVEVLVPVEPFPRQARVEPEKGQGGEDVLIQRLVVAVHVVGDLVVVAPHQRAAAGELAGKTKEGVDGGTIGHGAVVATVLDGEADPGAREAEEGAGGGAGRREVQGPSKASVAKDGGGGGPRATPVGARGRAGQAIEKLIAHAVADGDVEGRVVGARAPGHGLDWEALQDGQPRQPRRGDGRSHVVRLEESGGVAADGEAKQHFASRVSPGLLPRREVVRQVIGDTAVHCPCKAAPGSVVPRVGAVGVMGDDGGGNGCGLVIVGGPERAVDDVYAAKGDGWGAVGAVALAADPRKTGGESAGARRRRSASRRRHRLASGADGCGWVGHRLRGGGGADVGGRRGRRCLARARARGRSRRALPLLNPMKHSLKAPLTWLRSVCALCEDGVPSYHRSRRGPSSQKGKNANWIQGRRPPPPYRYFAAGRNLVDPVASRNDASTRFRLVDAGP